MLNRLLVAALLAVALAATATHADTSTATTIVAPVETATTVADRDAFLGTYDVVAGCVSSATCCCSTGPMTITAGTATNALSLAGTTDGGAACFGLTTLSGTFTLYQPLAAYLYLSFVPALMQIETDSTHQYMQFNTSK